MNSRTTLGKQLTKRAIASSMFRIQAGSQGVVNPIAGSKKQKESVSRMVDSLITPS